MLANTTRTLTEAQREQWAVDGYLQIEGALSSAEVDFFSRLLDDTVRTAPGYEPARAPCRAATMRGSCPTRTRTRSWTGATCFPTTRPSST